MKKRDMIIEMARRCARAGYPLSTITHNLKPEYHNLLPEMEKKYINTCKRNNIKPQLG